MIIVVDYGMGNLGSIVNMFRRINVEAAVSSDPDLIERAHKLVLPGVGSFDVGMRNLRAAGLPDILKKRVVEQGTPLLGICLGMQLLARSSEEGIESGLGWLDATVVKFHSDAVTRLKVPHMGWNALSLKRESPLFKSMYPDPRFYFVHSYHVTCWQEHNIVAQTLYGSPFVSALQAKNIYGVQFHPEKSHKFGMKLFENFAAL